jgi:hypothetical protein
VLIRLPDETFSHLNNWQPLQTSMQGQGGPTVTDEKFGGAGHRARQADPVLGEARLSGRRRYRPHPKNQE